MASIGIVNKYQTLIKKLFPKGKAWEIEKNTKFDALVQGLSLASCRVEEAGFNLLNELDPNTTFELVDDWERLLGLPDECTPEDADLTLQQRRLRIVQKLTTGGGQNEAFFKLIASQLGYDPDAINVTEFQDFRAGIAKAGDPLTNSTDPGGVLNASGWAYAFLISLPADFAICFRAGQSVAGDRLKRIENETLECVIRKFAPAHVAVQFTFSS